MAAQRSDVRTEPGFQVRRFLKRPFDRAKWMGDSRTSEVAQNSGPGHISLFMVVMLCIGLTVAATFGEFAIGVLAPALKQDIGAEPSQLGMLMAIMFVCSALMAIPSGVISDRVDPRKTIFIQMSVAALAFGSIALVAEPAQLFISAAVIGAVMSLNQPMTNRIVINFVPLRQRSMAIAWKSVGLQVSALLTGLTFGITESFSHWRTTIIGVTVVLIVLGFLAHMRFRRADPIGLTPVALVTEVPKAHESRAAESNAEVAATPATSAPRSGSHSVTTGIAAHDTQPVRERIAAPIVWWLIPYNLFTTGAFTGVAAYMVLYATTEVGVSPAAAANASGIAAGISIFARFIWVRWLTKKNEALMLGLAAFSTAIAIAMLALSPLFGEVGFWIAAVALGFTLFASTPVQQVVLVQNTNPRYIGRVSSLVGIALSLSLAGMPFLIAIFIDGIGLKLTWAIVVGTTLIGGLTMVVYTIQRAIRQRRGTLAKPDFSESV